MPRSQRRPSLDREAAGHLRSRPGEAATVSAASLVGRLDRRAAHRASKCGLVSAVFLLLKPAQGVTNPFDLRRNRLQRRDWTGTRRGRPSRRGSKRCVRRGPPPRRRADSSDDACGVQQHHPRSPGGHDESGERLRRRRGGERLQQPSGGLVERVDGDSHGRIDREVWET